MAISAFHDKLRQLVGQQFDYLDEVWILIEVLADEGVDATIFKVPSNFPPVECDGRCKSQRCPGGRNIGTGMPDVLPMPSNCSRVATTMAFGITPTSESR